MSETPAASAPPQRCVLQHRMFAAVEQPLFRRADADGTPVMVVRLGERDAALPLRSLRREFAIDDASPDGRMLGLIAAALDFITVLRPGDVLPSEVLTGEASWEPDPVHLEIANARLRLQLIAWLRSGRAGAPIDLTAESLQQVADDPALRAAVQAAITRAAQHLGLADGDQVLRMLEALGEELAFIEALRERLLGRIAAAVAKIERIAAEQRANVRSETMTQVRRLAAIALARTRQRFEVLDAQTGEVLSALRNPDQQRDFIRGHRDWLYRSLRAWEPLLAAWETAEPEYGAATPGLLARSYQFLAPRFMPVTEWLSGGRTNQAQPSSQFIIW